MNIQAIHNSNVAKTFNLQNNTKPSGFQGFLEDSLKSLNDSQTIVATKQKEFVNGEIEAHQLISTVAESELALKLATSISGKLVSSIQEITNMQI